MPVKAASVADADGWARLTLPIENIEQAALLLLGIGPEIDVLKPVELRERLGTLALEVVRRSR